MLRLDSHRGTFPSSSFRTSLVADYLPVGLGAGASGISVHKSIINSRPGSRLFRFAYSAWFAVIVCAASESENGQDCIGGNEEG